MKGTILEKGEKYYTYLREIFSAINNVQKDYNRLITDCECYPSQVNLKRLCKMNIVGYLARNCLR